MSYVEQELYDIGDEVFIKSHFNDEPDDIGVVKEVDTTYGHAYYYVDYVDQSGRNMRCGCANKHIRGRLPRVEKVINEGNVIYLEAKKNEMVTHNTRSKDHGFLWT